MTAQPAAPPAPAGALLDRFYPARHAGERYRDGTAPFYGWMLRSIDAPRARVLNVGAGPTPAQARRRLRGRVGHLAGVDVDPLVLTNRDLDEARVIDGVHLPFDAGSFDAVYADWTMEHVADPPPLLAEMRRVLRPGASLWVRTPNLRHYASALAALTPYRAHIALLGLRGAGAAPWPTRYRLNTPGRIRSAVAAAGFARCEIRMVESWPGYLTFNRLAFLLGVGYERAVNSRPWLSGLRQIILVRATAREALR